MLDQSQIQTFRRKGFVLGGPLLDVSTLIELRSELQRIGAGGDPSKNNQPVLNRDIGQEKQPVQQIVNIWQASQPFHQLVSRSDIAADVALLTEAEELRVWHDQIQYKPPTTGGTTSWHQDAPAWPVLSPDIQVSAWIALDDADESNGCLWMVPGSHTWGVAPTFTGSDGNLVDRYEGREVLSEPCPVPAGYVHYHHCLTWHASFPNRSDLPRRAVAIHYMPETTTYLSSGEHPMKMFITVLDGEKLEGEVFPVVFPTAQ